MNSKKSSFPTKNSLLPTGKPSSNPEETDSDEKTEAIVPEVKQAEVEKRGGKTRRVEKYGSRRKVWNGSAEMTKGGLRKENLMKNTYGRIVSAKRHATMKKRHTV